MSLTQAIAGTDSIITNGIKEKAFPGALVLVAHKGEIVFHKAYGYHTYDSLVPVSLTDMYDLASLTKILGPLPILMKLYEEGTITLDEPFSAYWRPWRGQRDKEDITLREILAHQAGLQPYIVFMNDVLGKSGPRKRYLRSSKSLRFSKIVTDSLYARDDFSRHMFKEITRSEVSTDKTYRYSGLAFLIFPQLIKELTGLSYEYLFYKHFGLPMETPTLGFNPKHRGFHNKIVPTEIDTIYRNTLVEGWVHDENASLLGGVSGNAGLFGTAMDVFQFMEMYRNYGVLHGERYLKEDTVKEFSSIQFADHDNRRGLGFDKPLQDNANRQLSDAYPAPAVSSSSFGHSGFTGTFAWADPENQLVYIFLSNRVHPYRSHRGLYELNIRPTILQLFYEALSP